MSKSRPKLSLSRCQEWTALRCARSPVPAEDRVLWADLDGTVVAATVDGRRLWSVSLGVTLCPMDTSLWMHIVGDVVLVTVRDDHRALRLADGEMLWRARGPFFAPGAVAGDEMVAYGLGAPTSYASSPVVGLDRLWIPDDTGGLHVFALA